MSSTPTTTTAPLAPEAAEAIRVAARAFERDRYLAALLAPRDVRDDLIVLAAFAGEVGRIPASVSEPMLGEIRLQWWRDALVLDAREAASAGGRATGHPVADAMQVVIARHDLDRASLDRLLDATGRLLEDRPHRDAVALAETIAAIDGTLFALAARIATGRPLAPAEASAAANAGEAYGHARVLAEAAILAGEGRSLLPGDDSAAPADRAEQALGELRLAWRDLSRKVQCALLPVALVGPYLRLSRGRTTVAPDEGESAVHRVDDILPLARVWHLMRAHVIRRV